MISIIRLLFLSILIFHFEVKTMEEKKQQECKIKFQNEAIAKFFDHSGLEFSAYVSEPINNIKSSEILLKATGIATQLITNINSGSFLAVKQKPDEWNSLEEAFNPNNNLKKIKIKIIKLKKGAKDQIQSYRGWFKRVDAYHPIATCNIFWKYQKTEEKFKGIKINDDAEHNKKIQAEHWRIMEVSYLTPLNGAIVASLAAGTAFGLYSFWRQRR